MEACDNKLYSLSLILVPSKHARFGQARAKLGKILVSPLPIIFQASANVLGAEQRYRSFSCDGDIGKRLVDQLPANIRNTDRVTKFEPSSLT